MGAEKRAFQTWGLSERMVRRATLLLSPKETGRIRHQERQNKGSLERKQLSRQELGNAPVKKIL